MERNNNKKNNIENFQKIVKSSDMNFNLGKLNANTIKKNKDNLNKLSAYHNVLILASDLGVRDLKPLRKLWNGSTTKFWLDLNKKYQKETKNRLSRFNKFNELSGKNININVELPRTSYKYWSNKVRAIQMQKKREIIRNNKLNPIVKSESLYHLMVSNPRLLGNNNTLNMADIIFTANDNGVAYSRDLGLNNYIDILTDDIINNIRLIANSMGGFRLEITSMNKYIRDKAEASYDVTTSLPVISITDISNMKDVLIEQFHKLVGIVHNSAMTGEGGGSGGKFVNNINIIIKNKA